MTEAQGLCVIDLIERAAEYLRCRGYADDTIKGHRLHWQKFAEYAVKKRTQQFSSSLAADFVKRLPSTRGRPYWHMSHLIRHSMRVLVEFAETQQHQPRRIPSFPRLPDEFETEIENSVAFAKDHHGWATNTLKSRNAWLRHFIGHLVNRRKIDGWNSITGTDITDFLSSLEVKVNSRAAVLTNLKAMFRILFARGVLSTPLHEKAPRIRRSDNSGLSAIWHQSESEAILSAIDTSTPIGKRNYAVLLLAMRLGLRTCDIRTLRLDDLLWEQSSVAIVQQKTKAPLALPLLPDVGDAIIDYLRHGRPSDSFREVFLRHTAPSGPLGTHDFRNVLQACCRKAGIPMRQYASMNSLRHTLATRMLEGGSSVEIVSGVLGHTCIETTRRYIRIDVSLLRQAILDPDEEVAHA